MLHDHLEAHKIRDQVALVRNLPRGNILFDIDDQAHSLYLAKSHSTSPFKLPHLNLDVNVNVETDIETIKEENVRLKRMLIAMHKKMGESELERGRLEDRIRELTDLNKEIERKFN